MATVLTNTTPNAIGSYVGETKGQIRDGFGVYNYPNKFFRYEGEWKNGKKHGHGRLIMADGSFYEGEFKDGEIQGHGFRTWSCNKNSYTGQFVHGEMCGDGVMMYGNGDVYEGRWQNNRREGNGTLKEANGNVYEGSFHEHRRHGEGYQLYSNGDHYEGDWVKGMKQGHGTMKYYEGTIYDGQWRDDAFNGQGSIIHISGMMYEGIWIGGRPAIEAFTLAVSGSKVIEVEQGKPFCIDVVCQSVDGDRTQDDGRLLQVTAGVRITSTKRFSIDGKLSEHEIIPTPFDFDVEPYPITELTPDCDDNEYISSSVRNDPPSPIMENSDQTADEECQDDQTKPSASPPPAANATSSGGDGVTHFSSFAPDDCRGGEDTRDAENGSQVYLSPIIPALRTVSGRATFGNLYLLPSPSDARSYCSVLEERDVADGRTSQGQKIKRGREGKKGSVQLSATDIVELKEGRRKKEKRDEKTTEDKTKYCKPGDYVIIVRDITSPPFLGTTLQPTFCHVKVNPRQKRAKSKMDRR